MLILMMSIRRIMLSSFVISVVSRSDATLLEGELYWRLMMQQIVQHIQSDLEEVLHSINAYQELGLNRMCLAVPPHHLGKTSLLQVDGHRWIAVVDVSRGGKAPLENKKP